MTASDILFYIISIFILTTGILSVTSKKIFRSAIWLLTSLVGIAALYFWMQLNFLAAVQIIVYVGGIVVLIIFSIFLTQKSGSEMPAPRVSRKFFSLLAILAGCTITCLLLWRNVFPSNSATPFPLAVSDIGTQMLSTTSHGYVLPFELVSMLLLAALIGCIVIAMKKEKT